MKRPEAWITATLVNSVAIQASTYMARPMITYKLLGLHASNFSIGAFGALYALFPLILAIPLGRWINQFGEGRFIFSADSSRPAFTRLPRNFRMLERLFNSLF